MSLIQLTCPSCARTLEIDNEAIGLDVECGACSEIFVAGWAENNAGKSSSTGKRAASPVLEKRTTNTRKRRKHRDNDDYDHNPRSGRRGDRGYDDQKSRLAFVLFGIFLGNLGIHNFYAGRTVPGIAQLLITLISIPLLFFCVGFVTIWIPTIWSLVEIAVVDEDGNHVPMVS